eukprot:GILK01000686.1.p1 GENE.GILK01000686.1~~GILK01000686.1.p1  ORF type:complete len:336 (+),score=73.73 GILK01000686.1:443-1450(+)
MADPRYNCRMYEQKYPEVEDLVMVQVKSVAEMGAYVSLLEYNNIEGMILLSELSRRRIRSVNKLIRVGRQEVVVVLRVDKEKGYIDLSKRRVSPEDIQKCEEKFNKSKTVHSIMRHVAETLGKNLEELYTQFGWPLFKKFGHAYDAFKIAISPGNTTDVFEGIPITEEVKDALFKHIKRRLTPQPVKIRADVEVTCFDYEGIEAIRTSLRAAEACGTVDVPVKIKLVAPPLYVLVANTLEKDLGIQLLNNAVAVLKQEIESRKGGFVLKAAARAVGDREEKQLLALMEDLEMENREVSGDEEEDEEGMTADIGIDEKETKEEESKESEEEEEDDA